MTELEELRAELAAAQAKAAGAHDAAQLMARLRDKAEARAECYRRRAFAMRRSLGAMRRAGHALSRAYLKLIGAHACLKASRYVR